jgi:hypothetical protein
MKIVLGDWFKLPFLGKDVFQSLMRAGVKYKSGAGFMLTEETDVKMAVGIIASVTGEEAEIYLKCFICGKEACRGCPFISSCDRTSVSPACLCEDHSRLDSFDVYRKYFMNLAGYSSE